MDRLFDRLGDLLRVLMGADGPARTGYDARDPDMRAALKELDEYLASGAPEGWRFAEETERRFREERQRPGPRSSPPEALRRDYGNLEVPFGAPLEQVQKSYRNLLRKYHPDRFARDAEKQQLATEITKRINESYRNITRHQPGSRQPET